MQQMFSLTFTVHKMCQRSVFFMATLLLPRCTETFTAKVQLWIIKAIALDIALITWQLVVLISGQAILCYLTNKGKNSLLAQKKSTLGPNNPLLTAQEHIQSACWSRICGFFVSFLEHNFFWRKILPPYLQPYPLSLWLGSLRYWIENPKTLNTATVLMQNCF